MAAINWFEMKNRIGFLLLLFFGVGGWMALLKLPFMGLYLDGVGWSEWLAVIRHGWPLDQTVAGYITALPLLLVLLSLWIPATERLWRRLIRLFLTVVALVATAIFILDLGLYGYWGYRIDSSVMIYLASPREAIASLSPADWLMGCIAAPLLLGGFIALFWGVTAYLKTPKCSLATRLWGTPLLLILGGLCFLAIRGGAGVAVANISRVYFSADQRLNHAAINPLFSLLSTIGNERDMEPQYLFFEEQERAMRFEELRGDRPDTVAAAPLLRTPRPDVVLILLESFGRTFTDEQVDGEPVAPNLQRYKAQGIWFENLFANSFRTDRGEVAILNGYPAQTRMSIMKYPNKSHSLPSIARSLGREGYVSSFLYGGDLNFTDQASYMYATGWQQLTWLKDLRFDAPQSKWGYADDVVGDYFTRELLDRIEPDPATRPPQLMGWLTLSSHEPFEVPYAKFARKELNAVAFTDQVVGQMLDRWSQSPAWEHLLIILIADHGYLYPDHIAYNASERHRIPMLWVGGAIKEPQVVESYASQSDLAATLLAQLGIAHDDYPFSRNILDPSTPKFGYWCFNDGFGVADQAGESLYDCTSNRLLSPGADSLHTVRLNYGKTLLQTTYKDIRER